MLLLLFSRIFLKLLKKNISVRQAEKFVQLFKKKGQKSKTTKDTNIIALELSVFYYYPIKLD